MYRHIRQKSAARIIVFHTFLSLSLSLSQFYSIYTYVALYHLQRVHRVVHVRDFTFFFSLQSSRVWLVKLDALRQRNFIFLQPLAPLELYVKSNIRTGCKSTKWLQLLETSFFHFHTFLKREEKKNSWKKKEKEKEKNCFENCGEIRVTRVYYHAQRSNRTYAPP